MKKYFVLILVAAVLAAIPAAADDISLSGSNSATTTVGGGSFVFGNNSCYNGTCYGGSWGTFNSGVTTYSSTQITVPLGSLSLPSGATLTSATLSWGTTGASNGTAAPATRSETDYQYYGYTYYYSYGCGWGHTCYGSYPVYYNGYGGSATIYDASNTGNSLLTFGNFNSLLLSPSGSLDLLAAGYGNDLLSGAMTLTGSGSSSMWASINSTGYYATTSYSPALIGNTFNTTATLNVTYSTPAPLTPAAPVAEPASFVMLAGGLAGIILRRQRS